MVIRSEQIKAFEQDALRRFEDEMVRHSKDVSPRLSEVLGGAQLRVAVRAALARAQTYGFTNRGPARLFVEMMFLCGSSFDTDPQYPGISEALRAPEDQMIRAEKIHQGQLEYVEKVSGPGAMNVHAALRDLAVFASQPLPFDSANLTSGMLAEMRRLFPKKAEHAGDAALQALIGESRSDCLKYGFSTVRQMALIAVLKFGFGHGCTHDPLYPWIENTLQDPRIVSPEARAARLENKARTWLDHVNARNERRTKT